MSETLRPIDVYFLHKEEPAKSCLQFLRKHILKQDTHITEAWKYSMPFFCYKGKMMCYLWVHKKYKQPYLGIVQGARMTHPDLLQEKRARMKILLIDPAKDLPIRKINLIVKEMLSLYKSDVPRP
jgi:hypothetical protein